VLAGLAMWRHEPRNELAQSCPCVRLTHGLGRVGSTVANVLKFSEDCANAFKARLDQKIWLHQAVKFVSWVGLRPNFSTWVWLGQSDDGWVGSGQTKWTHGQLSIGVDSHR